MERFGIRIYRDEIRDKKIGLLHDCLWLMDGDQIIIMGSNVKKTRKGFYYDDVFFKKQFVSWSILIPID